MFAPTAGHEQRPAANKLSRDAILIYAAAFVRSSTVGLAGVILAIYFSELGFSPVSIGMVIGAGLGGGALATVGAGMWGDGFGRRRSLLTLAVITATGYALIAVTSAVPIVALVAFFGMLNGMGRDRGAASSLEQAILPSTTGAEQRTWVLAWYNVALDAGHAFGALAGATPTLLIRTAQLSPIDAHRVTFVLCSVAMLIAALPYVALSQMVEVRLVAQSIAERSRLSPASKRSVTRLAVLFGLDSLGGGFLNSALIAYWFFRRYGASEAELAVLFFLARVLNAGSHVAAAWLARRIGLVNTMVFTHLPSSLFMLAVPAASSAAVARTLFLAREALVEMDVPTRQSYVMAIVKPEERTFASGVTNLTRSVSWAAGPLIAGPLMQYVSLATPLFVGGALKIVYDVVLYKSFRNIRPPEEASGETGRSLTDQ